MGWFNKNSIDYFSTEVVEYLQILACKFCSHCTLPDNLETVEQMAVLFTDTHLIISSKGTKESYYGGVDKRTHHFGGYR